MAKFCPHCQGVFSEKTVEEHIENQHFDIDSKPLPFALPLDLELEEPNSNLEEPNSNPLDPLDLEEPNSNHSNLDLNKSYLSRFVHDVNENKTEEKSSSKKVLNELAKELWHICEYCEKQFMHYRNMINHIRTKHRNETEEEKENCLEQRGRG